MDNLKAAFIEEVTDLIADLEKSLLTLENNQQDKAIVERIFRVMHTLKGSSLMFGFNMIGDLTHNLETIYDYIRLEKAVVTEEILSITLMSVDHIKVLLNTEQKLGADGIELNKKLLKEIERLVSKLEGIEEPEEITELEKEALLETLKTFYIIFRPKENILQNGSNPLYVLEDLHGLGECKISAHHSNIPDFDALEPTKCYVYWDIYLATKETEKTIREAFMFVEGDCTLEIHIVANENILSNPKFIDRVEGSESMTAEELKEFANSLLHFIQTKGTQDERIAPASVKEGGLNSIRVATDKLDNLMNMVSELITVQARLSLFAEKNGIAELESIAENVNKISRQLRDNVFSICLIPFETLLTKYQRLVRDLSQELDKEVVFITEGGDTELDKTIIETLNEPLLHMIRNCIDHAIEYAPQREQAGKPRQGTVILKAFYSGSQVHVQIKDDGRGIDPERVRKKAIEKSLISPDVFLTAKECLELVFLPGFSTAEKVTGVSGRGVGMDVVKRKITELRGEIALESKVNEGTIITIKLPLTLSIIEGLLVKIDSTNCIIPLTSVEKCYEIKHSKILAAFNNCIVLDGEQVPFFYLRDEFKIDGYCPELHQVVTITFDGQRVGLVVDSIVGEYQAVLKPLGRLYKNINIISGGTILGDGTVALVLDPHKIIKEFSDKILINN